MNEDKIIKKLKELLENAVKKTCFENKIGVIFSGGLDSGIIAFLAKKFSNVTAYCVGVENSNDVLHVKNLVNKVKEFKIKIKIFDIEEVKKILPKILKIVEDKNPTQISCAIPIYFASREANKDKIKVMLIGQGGDELFGGYNRYLKHVENEKKLEKILLEDVENIYRDNLNRDVLVCKHNGIELRAPYMDEELKNFSLKIPIKLKIKEIKDGEFSSCIDIVNKKKFVRKYILRKVAEEIELPKEIINRRKKAMQYGSGSWKILKKLEKY